MMRTKDIGRLFFCRIPLTDAAPVLHTAPMYQAVWPYLLGKTAIIRWRRGHGIVLGWWTRAEPGVSEHDLLLRPLQGRDLTERMPAYTGERTAGYNLPNCWGVDHVPEINPASEHDRRALAGSGSQESPEGID